MTYLYGIKNCDTIKKAKTWLTQQEIAFQFHDYRTDGITAEWLKETEKHLGWELMLNKKGTTFRQLSESQKQDLNQESALSLMLEFPAMIKRPILIHQQHYYCGFKAEQYHEIFSQ
ncbi:ArsC family reductase [Paraglaciecola hydrolytica]|uniref:Arsenate reductase n=1 Tax=Paraglaciecola hydrolytica TaxID=1799789 RepID=A0A136A0W5_9ALTE|nr:ArsC family reductase [Paraglaciecola hydrolytica]KXI28790.1 arsenate reductase [Paraglaciecola hydrolytica]